MQVYHPEAFEQMGIRLADKHIVAVKSLFHFYAPFAEIAAEVIQAATPGGTCPDFEIVTVLASNFANIVYVSTTRGLLGLEYRSGQQVKWRALFRE